MKFANTPINILCRHDRLKKKKQVKMLIDMLTYIVSSVILNAAIMIVITTWAMAAARRIRFAVHSAFNILSMNANINAACMHPVNK